MTDPSFARQLITFTDAARRQLRRQRGGDGVRPHPRRARAIMRAAVNYDDAPGRRAGLARLAARQRHPGHHGRRHARARPPHPRRRARCAAAIFPADDAARPRRASASPPSRAWSAATSPARSRSPSRGSYAGRRRRARGSSRSTPASSARSSATSPRAARRSSSTRARRRAEELLARDPDGFFLVPGPGDPAALGLHRRHRSAS